MKWISNVLRDLLLALVLGLGVGLAAGAALWCAGALAGGVSTGFVAARSGLLLAGGFTLLFSAVLLLKGGSLPREAFQLRPRPRAEEPHPAAPLPRLFRVVNRRYVALFIGVGILLVAAVADGIVRSVGA